MIPLLYIDPSSASLIFQAAAGAILAGGLTVRLWWGRMRYIISALFGHGHKGE